MNCAYVRMPNGAVAIVCGHFPRAKRCRACACEATHACDWKVGPGRTCDAPLCSAHAFEVEPGKHLCPAHVATYRQWLRDQGIPLQ